MFLFLSVSFCLSKGGETIISDKFLKCLLSQFPFTFLTFTHLCLLVFTLTTSNTIAGLQNAAVSRDGILFGFTHLLFAWAELSNAAGDPVKSWLQNQAEITSFSLTINTLMRATWQSNCMQGLLDQVHLLLAQCSKNEMFTF